MKDPMTQRLTAWTMLAIFVIVMALVGSGVIWLLVAIWRRILGG